MATWRDLAQTLEAVRGVASRREKIRLLSRFLAALPDEDLRRACTFLSGRVFPVGDPRTGNLGGSAIVRVLQELAGADDRTIQEAYLRWGDLGDVAQELLASRRSLSLFSSSLTLEDVARALAQAAEMAGKGAREARLRILRHLLAAASPLEAKYLVRILTGEIRIGLREGLLEEAIAEAFGVCPSDVRRAMLLQADPGEVAVLARAGSLSGARLGLFRPFRFMLAEPIFAPEEAFAEAPEWLAEDKYDGIRVQVHRAGDRVALYSRTLDDITGSFPELVPDLRALAETYVADGELVAWREERALPFQALQRRLRRQDPADLVHRVPVVLMLFDLLRLGDEDLLDAPLRERRKALSALRFTDRVRLARAEEVREVEAIVCRFREARERGNEGLVLKRVDAPYRPGRRGRLWLKLKEEMATLDVVVVAVERGHGKRAGVLSDYTFAVRDGAALRVVGKAYSGLTDREIAELTRWFEAHTLRDCGRLKLVEPRIVLEVAFDAVTRSDRHDSGYALRFPRIKRLRPDKSPQEASTLAEVEALFRAQQRRFSGAPK
ncbi:MAG: ATP-dependent DNA ligase [Armatimonadota bacterium]|nr:ATP-dependent DNA ligase [Armatimonadota bacterium]MDR7563290.1 ATP-dependent DNA ligase [Armatimonadota bacterium]MDR7567762.1 ATP-dependent DNA ligase [Armatimonadota bacterium]